MHFIYYPAATPAHHLACDESLLDLAEEGTIGECLRIYEVRHRTIVLGIQDEYARAANVELCRQHDVPVLRRRSGGGTVLLASGCLLYTILLRRNRPRLRSVRESYEWIFSRLSPAISTEDVSVQQVGISDLAWNGYKVGGSAQQRKKNYLMHHGTLLYDADPGLIEQFVGEVRDAPQYRRGRTHADFVTNLPFSRDTLSSALRQAFNADQTPRTLPNDFSARVNHLVQQRYHSCEWTRRR